MAISTIATALMPISQAVAWYAVLATKPLSYPNVMYTALFYCLWALYNRYIAGVTQELGQYSMGFMTVAAYFQNRPVSMIAATVVLLNFLLPAYYILYKWGLKELAENVKNDTSRKGIIWAIVFKTYFVSQIGLWCTILFKLYRAGTTSYQRVASNNARGVPAP